MRFLRELETHNPVPGCVLMLILWALLVWGMLRADNPRNNPTPFPSGSCK